MLKQLTGQVVPEPANAEDDKKADQTRGQGVSEQDKFRITFEACQGVFNYFDDDKGPVGAIMRSSLILAGSHGRLSNIDDDGLFISDEAFDWKGKQVLRRAGTSAKGLMKGWVLLRKMNPEARKMLESSIDVYQQPSGFVDSIVTKWITERQSEFVVQAVHQKDLFAAALGEVSKRACFLSHVFQAWIAGKMTAVLQLTDTDIAYVLKSASRRVKAEVKREMRSAASAAGEVATFKCGFWEILRIAYESHQAVVEENAKNKTVLAGMRRNGMLSWRPDTRNKKLVRSDEQAWAKGLPEGSHRYPKEWLEDRYTYHEDGVHLEPDWRTCGKLVEKPEDMEDATQHGEEGCIVNLTCWKGNEELADGIEEPFIDLDFDQDACDLKMNAELYEECKTAEIEEELNKLTESHIKGREVKNTKKTTWRQKRVLERRGIRKAMRSWRKNTRSVLKTYSRQQILAAEIPIAGAKSQPKPTLKAKLALKAAAATAKKTKAMKHPLCNSNIDDTR